MKKLKVLGVAMLCIVMTMFTGCGKQKALEQPIKIAALNGPTGMGMTKMIDEGNKDYEISLYQSPDEVMGKVISGELDIACVPSNMAAVLYTKTEKNVCLLATNTLGTLYILENGTSIQKVEDLKGKTIVASGKGSTPEYVLNEILAGASLDPTKDVTVNYLGNHTDVVTELVSKEGTIALLPQPHVTIAATKNENVHIALDLNEAWEASKQAKLPMGVIIANKTYVEAHPEAIEAFLKDYEASVKFVNENVDEAAKMMAEQKILPSEAIAKTAIPNCHIVYEDAAASKADLVSYFTLLKEINPKSIGGNLPDEDFYYSK